MNVAIFGGTFDPVHRGHLAVARAARDAYRLGRIYFVPADVPPHKQKRPLTAYAHRYAMLALALRAEQTFVPSLIESFQPRGAQKQKPNYSIDTVRRFRALLPSSARLFFLIGIDAFLEIATWRAPEQLLREVEFIIASRPGFSLGDVAGALPSKLKSEAQRAQMNAQGRQTLTAGGAKLHLLPAVAEKASSSRIRAAAASGRAWRGLLDESVVEYIHKEHLYKGARY